MGAGIDVPGALCFESIRLRAVPAPGPLSPLEHRHERRQIQRLQQVMVEPGCRDALPVALLAPARSAR